MSEDKFEDLNRLARENRWLSTVELDRNERGARGFLQQMQHGIGIFERDSMCHSLALQKR